MAESSNEKEKKQGPLVKDFLISFIDVLGFSKLINDENHSIQKIYDSLERILIYPPDIHITKTRNYYYGLYGETADLTPDALTLFQKNYYNFSDSILLYLEAPKTDDPATNINRFQTISWATIAFIAEAIIEDRGKRVFQMPLRGAIAYGPVLVSENNKIHVGRPIVDAYNLANSMNWMGGAIHPSAAHLIVKEETGFNKWIVKYQVPLKNFNQGKIEYALNWPIQHPFSVDWVKGHRRPRIEDLGHNHVLKHDWTGAEDKRDETMKFLRFICDSFTEGKKI